MMRVHDFVMIAELLPTLGKPQLAKFENACAAGA